MAGFAGPIEGTQIKLYYSDALVDHTHALLGAVTTEVLCVTDIGATESTFNVIEYNKFGSPSVSKIPGQSTTGDFTFDFAWDDTDTVHMSLVGHGDGAVIVRPVPGTFIVEYNTGSTAETLIAMDGFISSVSTAAAVDGVTTVTVTVSIEARPTIVREAT